MGKRIVHDHGHYAQEIVDAEEGEYLDPTPDGGSFNLAEHSLSELSDTTALAEITTDQYIAFDGEAYIGRDLPEIPEEPEPNYTTRGTTPVWINGSRTITLTGGSYFDWSITDFVMTLTVNLVVASGVGSGVGGDWEFSPSDFESDPEFVHFAGLDSDVPYIGTAGTALDGTFGVMYVFVESPQTNWRLTFRPFTGNAAGQAEVGDFIKGTWSIPMVNPAH